MFISGLFTYIDGVFTILLEIRPDDLVALFIYLKNLFNLFLVQHVYFASDLIVIGLMHTYIKSLFTSHQVQV